MSESQKPTLIPLDPPERRRVYHFANGEELVLDGVTHLEVRASGKHRLVTSAGRMLFVNTDWLWIEIQADDWTF